MLISGCFEEKKVKLSSISSDSHYWQIIIIIFCQ
jgi:hypothetical protein